MLDHYVTEQDRELRARSNRTYERLVAALPRTVAARYGYLEPEADPLEKMLRAAAEWKDWEMVSRLSAQLREGQPGKTG